MTDTQTKTPKNQENDKIPKIRIEAKVPKKIKKSDTSAAAQQQAGHGEHVSGMPEKYKASLLAHASYLDTFQHYAPTNMDQQPQHLLQALRQQLCSSQNGLCVLRASWRMGCLRRTFQPVCPERVVRLPLRKIPNSWWIRESRECTSKSDGHFYFHIETTIKALSEVSHRCPLWSILQC